MSISYRTDKDALYIALSGRIDASNATDIEREVFEIKKANPDKRVVVDADNLEYISSAGLRIILKLRKEDASLAIINVSPEVYDVLDMTGFTDMVTVEKAYRRISVDGCEFIAKGANGAVYRYDEETIVKTYFAQDALDDIQQERENARKAFVLGVNTAIPYDVVRVGDGYGTVMELLNAKSISKHLIANPEEIATYVDYFVNTLKHIHSIEVKKGELRDYKDWVVEWCDYLKEHLPEDKINKLNSLIAALPQSTNMIHGDYHTNNIMLQNGETLLIDLDTLSVGVPVFELGSMYNAFLGFSELDNKRVEKFMGYDRTMSQKFWHMSLAKYLGTDDENIILDAENKARVVGYTRILRRSIRRNEGEDVVAHYKKQLCDLLDIVDDLNI